MSLSKSSFIRWKFAAAAAAAMLGAAIASTPAAAIETGAGGRFASSVSLDRNFIQVADRGDRRHHRGDRHRSHDRHGDRHRDGDRDRRAHHGGDHDRHGDRHHRRDRHAHHRHDRHYAYGGRSHHRHSYRGHGYRHGHGPHRAHGYFCLDHGIFHYYSGYDPYGFSVTAYYRGAPYRGAADCYPVAKIEYYHGRRALVGGLMCYDPYGYSYIRAGSRYVENYY